MSEINSTTKTPRVSIGVPVYNGGDLLKLALDSLLAQNYTDYELIISDNASTDNTEEICRDYASRDSRITYLRRDRNYGMNNNGVKVFSLAKGTYYMGASHDDQWRPNFLGECVARLDANPSLIMAVPAVQFLAPDGTPCDFPYPPLHTVGMGLRGRVASIFNQNNVGYNSYGLYRRDAILKIDLQIDCYGGDVVVLMQLMFHGEVEYIPQKLFTYRLNGRTAQEQMEAISKKVGDQHPTKPYTILTINLFRAIVNADVSPALKRILLSDALEVIAIKNPDWRTVLLSENRTLIPFIEPSQNGFFPSTENNLVAAFASLLLPYCQPGTPFEAVIDFSDINAFNSIPPEHTTRPSPGHLEFVNALTKQVEGKMVAQALIYYDEYRQSQPNTDTILRIDHLIENLMPSHRRTSTPVRRQVRPTGSRLRILFQNRPTSEAMPGGDTIVQQRLQEQLEALGHSVVFTTEMDISLSHYDIVHSLNITLPQNLEGFLNNALRQHTPFVVTTLQEDIPRYYSKARESYYIMEKYIEQGQRPEVFETLRQIHPNSVPTRLPTSALAARYAHRLLACGLTEAQFLHDLFPSASISVTPFGSSIIDSDVSKELFQQTYGVKDFVLCVARLETRKNQLMLLKALENEDIPVVFVDGGFTYQPKYASLCKAMKRRGRSFFTGRLSNEMLVSAYRAARVHCLPSWYELPGLVTLEAARYGCATVASSWGCIKDYLGALCEYCEPDSPESIRDAVLRAYQEGPKPGSQEHASTFTWEAAVKKVESIYNEVLE